MEDILLLAALIKETFVDYAQQTFNISAVDVDYFLFGNKITFPIEIKEKTPAEHAAYGQYFGIDSGHFVKLSYFVKAGDAIFAVREIDDETHRRLVSWKYVKFSEVLEKSDWVGIPGGPPMVGRYSFTVKIPYSVFADLTRDAINTL
ncbi:MAG: hypothetical protein HMLIMOIP_000928 [Candidatus Nitrosomirales archaeon]|jgi:hypothetical protein